MKEKVDKKPKMDFEKPLLTVGLKKLNKHLKEENELSHVEEVSNLKKNLTFWKLKNRQFYYESQILNKRFQRATTGNRQYLGKLEALHDQLLEYASKGRGSKGEFSAMDDSHLSCGKSLPSIGCPGEPKKPFKPKSILLKGTSFADKSMKKQKPFLNQKKVSFASDFDLNEHENRQKMKKMTSCFMEEAEREDSGLQMEKIESFSIRDEDLIPEEEENNFEVKVGETKNSYLFVDNEKYQSNGSSENLSDLGRSFPPQVAGGNSSKLQNLRDDMLFIQIDSVPT